jgi:hypothetical protein
MSTRRKLRKLNAQSIANPQENEIRRVSLAQFDPPEVIDMDLGQFGEGFLREGTLFSRTPNAFPELPQNFLVRHLAPPSIRH